MWAIAQTAPSRTSNLHPRPVSGPSTARRMSTVSLALLSQFPWVSACAHFGPGTHTGVINETTTENRPRGIHADLRHAGDGADHLLRRRRLSRPRLHHQQAGGELRAQRLQRPRLVGRGRPRPLGGLRARRTSAGRCVVLRRGSYDSLSALGLDNNISSVRPPTTAGATTTRSLRPMEPPDYAWRRRANERVFEAPVTSVHAVMGAPTSAAGWSASR